MTPVRLLIVEDSAGDAELMAVALRRGGIEVNWERVESAAALADALARSEWAVVLADHSLPQFDAPSALRLVREHDPDLPFLVVSGAVDEDTAVELMRCGADDFVLKTGLTCLAPAVLRAIREAGNRRARRAAERSARDLAAIVESSEDSIIGLALDGTITAFNRGAERNSPDGRRSPVRPTGSIAARAGWMPSIRTTGRRPPACGQRPWPGQPRASTRTDCDGRTANTAGCPCGPSPCLARAVRSGSGWVCTPT